MIWLALVATFLAAVFGAVAGAWVANQRRRELGVLVCLATGALLGVTVFDILPESGKVLAWPGVLVAGLCGFGLLGAINHYVFEVCPSCGVAHLDQNRLRHDRAAFPLLAVALGAHCFFDGMAVTAGTDLHARLGVAAGLAIHKLPEGLALSLLLMNAGYGALRSIVRSTAIESITLLGGLVGATFLGAAAPKPVIGATFAVVAGGFVFLVVNAVGGLMTKSTAERGKAIGIQAASFAATGVLMTLLSRAG